MPGTVLNGVVAPLAALAIFLAAAVVVRLLWRRLLVRDRALGRPERWLADFTTTPVFLLVLAVGLQVAMSRLALLPELRRLEVTEYLTGAAYIFTVLCTAWVAYGLAQGFSEWFVARAAASGNQKLDPYMMPVFRRVAQVALVFAAVTVILDHYNVKITALLGAAGVASLAVALAAQDTLANMISGFTIMADRPFRIGDKVELPNGRVGDVQEIGLRSTKILSPDYTMLIIPNSEVAKSSLVNHSYPSDRTNVRMRLGVAYGADVERAKQVILEAVRAHPLVRREPEPNVLLLEFAEHSVQIQFNFWLDDFRSRGPVGDAICTGIYERFRSENIPFAVRAPEGRPKGETAAGSGEQAADRQG